MKQAPPSSRPLDWAAVERKLHSTFPLRLRGEPGVFFQGALLAPEVDRHADGRRISFSGKGLSPEAARLSCLGEAAEYLSFLRRPDDPLVRDPPGAVRFCVAPAGDVVLVPEAEVLRVPLGMGSGARASSNGLGAGADPHAARLHGLLECVERHAVMGWWLCQRLVPDIDPDLTVQAVPERANTARRVWFKDLTPDFGVPVAGAFSMGSADVAVACGFAAGLTMTDAVQGAWLEAMQADLGRQLNADLGRPPPPHMPSLAAHPCLRPGRPPRRPRLEFDNFDALAGALEDRGIAVAWADLTRSDIGIPVARVLSRALQPPDPDRIVPALSARLRNLGVKKPALRALPRLY